LTSGQREARLTDRPDGYRAHFLKLSATGTLECRAPRPVASASSARDQIRFVALEPLIRQCSNVNSRAFSARNSVTRARSSRNSESSPEPARVASGPGKVGTPHCPALREQLRILIRPALSRPPSRSARDRDEVVTRR
jgi:hypothetical protein